MGKITTLKLDPRHDSSRLPSGAPEPNRLQKGCDHGQCGLALCTSMARRVNSCLCCAAMHEGDEITTLEGIGQPENLHPVQACLRNLRCLPLRAIAHPGRSFRQCALERAVRAGRCRGEGVHERQYLPVRSLSKHCRGYSECPAKTPSRRKRDEKLSNSRAPPIALKLLPRRPKRRPRNRERRFVFNRRRHNPDRPDEAECRAAADAGGYQPLPLDKIEALPDGGLTIGAVVRNSDLAYHPTRP